MFKTFEEIKEKYPIGTKLNYKSWKICENRPYYCEKDLEMYRKYYGEVTVLDECYCRVIVTKERYDEVQGYLFNGKEWQIVQETHDGWIEIEENS